MLSDNNFFTFKIADFVVMFFGLYLSVQYFFILKFINFLMTQKDPLGNSNIP